MLSGKEQTMNNYEQMCEALVYARTVLAKWSRDTPFGAWNEIGEAIDKCDAALSAPPRQCDIGTVEEQKERFDAFCNAQPQKRGFCDCILQKNQQGLCEGLCEFAWAQMPAEEGGAK